MKVKSYLKLVEIQTKIASLFPLLFGTIYTLYRYQEFSVTPFLLLFSSLLLFDMTTTAINNFMDYAKSSDDEYKKTHNVIGSDNLKKGEVLTVIFAQLLGAIALGVRLTQLAGPIILLLGAASFFVGIFYTFGPIPISRMPLGEILSGFFMGFIIIYISVFIHHPLASLTWDGGSLLFSVDFWETAALFLVSLPFVLTIGNLMLANNICDLEQDIKNDRYLLPYYVGRKNSLRIFALCNALVPVSMLVAVILGALPPMSLASLVIILPLLRNTRLFAQKQVKSETFILSVKNLTLTGLFYILPLSVWVISSRVI